MGIYIPLPKWRAQLEETLLAYLAGMLDAVGSVRVVGNVLVIEMELTDEASAQLFAAAFGARARRSERKCRQNPRSKPTWRCRFTHRRARQAYLLLERFLRRKRLGEETRTAVGLEIPCPPECG